MALNPAEIDNDIIREFWNGAWFMLTIGMVTALVAIMIDRISVLKKHKRWPRYDDMAIVICFSLIVFLAASGLRAGYLWLVLHCHNYTPKECIWIEDDEWWVMSLAGTFVVIGGLATIRALTPIKWRPWPCVIAGATSMIVPIAFYFVVRWH